MLNMTFLFFPGLIFVDLRKMFAFLALYHLAYLFNKDGSISIKVVHDLFYLFYICFITENVNKSNLFLGTQKSGKKENCRY